MDSEIGAGIAREVHDVLSDTLMIVRPKRTAKPVATVKSGYFAGNYENHTEIIPKIRKERETVLQKKGTYKDPTLSHINTGSLFEMERCLFLF